MRRSETGVGGDVLGTQVRCATVAAFPRPPRREGLRAHRLTLAAGPERAWRHEATPRLPRVLSTPTFELSPEQIRVLGCLLEKQRTTPDAYPLSLNALRLACNQSTNRDPVVDYDEATLRDALHRLERRGLVRLASGAGSRASKYRHLLAERLPMDRAEEAVMCVLMLRGAQTPGELKQRGERMHAFDGLEEVHSTLARLIERELVERLARRPGQKEERYRELLGDARPTGGEAAEELALRAPLPASSASTSGRARRATAASHRRTPATARRASRCACAELERAVASAQGARWRRRSPSAARARRRRDEPRGADPRLLFLGHGLGRRDPGGDRGGARLVPLALRAAARAGLSLDGDRRDATRPAGGRGRAARARAEPAVHRLLLGDLHPARAQRDGDRLLAADHKHTLDQVGGALILLMGLVFLATPFIGMLNREWHSETLLRLAGRGGPVLAGAAFAIAWTPCTCITLGAILTQAAISSSAAHGALLLAFYSAGLAIPFLLIALAFERMTNALAVVKRHFPVIIAVGGIVMIALGLLILTGEYTILNNKAQELTSELGLPSTSV